jgi:hypothetical protein
MDRRDFLAKAGLVATWAAVPVTISGCGDDDNPADPGNGNDIAGSVSFDDGHSHNVTITEAQIDAASAVTLGLTSSSGHTHSVSLTAEQVVDIGVGTQVSVPTNPDGTGHVHTCTFN